MIELLFQIIKRSINGSKRDKAFCLQLLVVWDFLITLLQSICRGFARWSMVIYFLPGKTGYQGGNDHQVVEDIPVGKPQKKTASGISEQ